MLRGPKHSKIEVVAPEEEELFLRYFRCRFRKKSIHILMKWTIFWKDAIFISDKKGTHTEYLILSAIPRQQRLRECVKILTYI